MVNDHVSVLETIQQNTIAVDMSFSHRNTTNQLHDMCLVPVGIPDSGSGIVPFRIFLLDPGSLLL